MLLPLEGLEHGARVLVVVADAPQENGAVVAPCVEVPHAERVAQREERVAGETVRIWEPSAMLRTVERFTSNRLFSEPCAASSGVDVKMRHENSYLKIQTATQCSF